jgi:hypothetical protein
MYRRAELVLSDVVAELREPRATGNNTVKDLVDSSIRSKRTLEEVRSASSAISRRWRVVSMLTTADFAHALRAAREVD